MSQRFWNWHAIISYDLKTKVSPYQERVADIIKALELGKDEYILDAGCGTGYLIKVIKDKHPYTRIEAVDFSREMLARSAKRCRGLKKINFRDVDLDKKLPYQSNTFDKIVCDNVLYAVPRPEFTLKEFYQVLRSHGKLVMVIPKPVIEGKAIVFHEFRGAKSIWKKILAFFKLIVTMILIMPFEMSISKKIKQGTYHALTGDQTLAMLEKVGFSKDKIGLTFADQNWIISAKKI